MTRAVWTIGFLLCLVAGATGDRAGNGGDPLAAEFVARGHYVLERLKADPEQVLLSRLELERFAAALRDTRIEFVDSELVDLSGRRVLCLVVADPADPIYRLIRVYRRDWTESQRLGADLVHAVFHAYLQVMGREGDDDPISGRLSVSERDFLARPIENPDCPNGRLESARISLNISYDFSGLREQAYVNGVSFDPDDTTSNRSFFSERFCTTKTRRFDVSLGTFYATVYLHGGEEVTLLVPSGREVYRR